MKLVSKSTEIGGRALTLEVGKFAEQATSAVLARYGDTMVLATVVASLAESKLDYFPLSVEYVERLYAGGRIKGSRWVKREGRPTDDAVLKGRLIDRSIRPLFDKSYHHDVQIVVTVLSVDGENDPDVLAIIAASAALSISPLPWDGPVGAVRLGYVAPKNGESGYFVNPGAKEVPFSEMDMVVSATEEKVIMLEAGMNEAEEDIVFKGIQYAKKEAQKIISLISDLTKEVGKKKIKMEKKEKNKELLDLIRNNYKDEIKQSILSRVSKEQEGDELKLLSVTISEKYEDKYESADIEKALETLFAERLRDDAISHGIRADGRKIDEIRTISCEVGLLPRTHGSAVFKRGQTQALTVATLGAPSMEQLIESPEGETAKRYMHHYSFPPYSVGETGRIGTPSRREIGHGALAERALLPVIPTEEEFPYTIRLVSEVMSSNGSTSMASTCGSTLSLMDAGVPIKRPVAGIATGLMTKSDTDYVILSDIIGIEDFSGDMDFKVAGTEKGITAIQLDVKIHGLTDKMIEETLSRAKKARLHILEKMTAVLPQPRPTLSQYAPKVAQITLPQDKIGEVIGPGGKMIRQIIAETGCTVEVDDDGKVTIMGTSPEGIEAATRWINGIIKVVQPEEVYEGIVKRILPFGAFVEILPGKEGMVHVSQMSTEYVSDPNQVVSLDQQVRVRVIEIDSQGRINLSMLFGEDAAKRPPQAREPRRDGGFRGGGDRRGNSDHRGGFRKRF
ncbi:polyribonucleotide nucleotidyltransferase [Candidatus Gottesmanbacteria bacterium RIFCSPHIGHO2_02_FULL_39_11]|uniref:Polyribonucleotide nucleotidyltransferase n=1 Tax=Candidatus Gottesmanbacteria bacterium RIFCSPHIGHO2_02_FULL_39_11 TaxID=1798382 RepID=A0A1F5ZX23_9BACT|nr:MAG: polyribonucleotide nucleotidyltransferase [Candidatus Gottesmanbacteria bacterium RIFCSPHIGHO2_02_FULL_39_11]